MQDFFTNSTFLNSLEDNPIHTIYTYVAGMTI